jgi:predicted DsbA family dithiol-disulfide isomerase
MMVIDVFQDVVCPWCRIGKKNMADALQKWDGEPVLVRWHAFFLDPTIPAEGTPFKEIMSSKMGGSGRLKEVFEHTAAAGKAVGLTFRFDEIEKFPNTLLSHLLIAYAPQEIKTEIVDAITSAYFDAGQDIGSIDVLVAIAEAAGLDASETREALLSKHNIKDIDQDIEASFKIGIRGVPFFIINNKYSFSGAQPPEAFLKALAME